MHSTVYSQILTNKNKGNKQLVLLIDPDEYNTVQLEKTFKIAEQSGVNYIFVGGSHIIDNNTFTIIEWIKKNSTIPVVIFPGNTLQFSANADAILFLSLISGRNPELLIGKHVEIAPLLLKSGIEVIPTGYMLIEGGKPTTASYISHSFPIPHNKADIAMSTAIAGELLGKKLIYMDTGSGADQIVSAEMIQKVSQHISIPLIVGGGIRKPEEANAVCNAGADVIVVGNAVEKDSSVLLEIGSAVDSF